MFDDFDTQVQVEEMYYEDFAAEMAMEDAREAKDE